MAAPPLSSFDPKALQSASGLLFVFGLANIAKIACKFLSEFFSEFFPQIFGLVSPGFQAPKKDPSPTFTSVIVFPKLVEYMSQCSI